MMTVPPRYQGKPGGPFSDPRSGVFDAGQLRQAIVTRGWTVAEFAEISQVSLACLYNALHGCGVSDRTAICIFSALRRRQPLMPVVGLVR